METRVASVRGPGERTGQLVVSHTFSPPPDRLETAVGIDAEGKIVGVVPLSAGGALAILDPGLSALEELRGVELARAEEETTRRAAEPSPRSLVWRTIGGAMRLAAQAVKTP
jgi:hypothetical protein